MRISELIFQGVLGVEKASRLRPDGALSRLDLPQGVSIDEVHDLVIACLYPVHLGEEQRERLKISDDAKLAVVLESKHGPLRIIRRADAASVRLQRKKEGGYEDVVTGASGVQAFLQEKLNLPSLKVFLPLHLWRFDTTEIPEPQPGAEFGDDPRIPELVEMYMTSLEVESIEDDLKELEMKVQDGQEALGQGAEVEDKLRRAREKLREIQVDEMSEEELELFQKKEEQLAEYRDQLDRLSTQEETERREMESLIPETPARIPLFWAGLVVAAAAMTMSFVFHEDYRMVALIAIPGFGICGFVLLQYFNKMGRASVHHVRLGSIRRRINQVLQEHILFRERIDHMLLHAGVEDENELMQRIPMAQKLGAIIAKLEEQLDVVRANPDYRRASKELDNLRQELADLQHRRQELPNFVMNSYQLENDLKSMGVDPVEVRKQADQQDDGKEPAEQPTTAFAWLRLVAEMTGQWKGAELDEAARLMWSKVCGHVLSDRFSQVDLTDDGRLTVGALTEEQLELWQRTRSSEVRAVLAALALALHVNAHKRARGAGLQSVWIGDPGEAMTPGHAEKFESVFRSAAKKSQIVICGPGR